MRIIEVKTMQLAQQHFLAAEKAVLECEQNLTALSEIKENACFIQSIGKNRWLISSKAKPAIQIGVLIDEKSHSVTRIHWRQVFE